MTFDQIVARVQARMNLTSPTSTTNIGNDVNDCYKEVASSIGIKVVERQVVTATTTINNRYLVFTCEKVLSVFNANFTPPLMMDEDDFEEVRDGLIENDPPTKWAVSTTTATTVTVILGSIPATQYVLSADAMVNVATLSGTQVPAFAEDYHDILVWGAMEIQYDKLEKVTMAQKFAAKKEKRLAEFRYYLACSAYKAQYAGKTEPQLNSVLPLVTD